MHQELIQAVCDQINREHYSAYLYYSMSSWAEYNGWKGLAKWLKVQHQEENVHADVLYHHLCERGARVIFGTIEKPPCDWESPLSLFEQVCAHEQSITESINNLATIAMKHNDHTFYQFIQTLLQEQVEEEGNTGDILVRMKRLNGHPELLDVLDNELSTRLFVNPFPGTQA